MVWLHQTIRLTLQSSIRFCQLANQQSNTGSSLPADEWTLCPFATWLANDLKAAAIKVYLLAVCGLHIEHSYHDAMSGCLRLQCVLKASNGARDLPRICDYQSPLLYFATFGFTSNCVSMMTLCFGQPAV
jgi:hypothetical protein